MSKRVFANLATTTLAAAITSSGATSITVTDGSVFPATGDFDVKVDNEIMTCTARSGNTLTVTRGVGGTTATTHANGATITNILTTSDVGAFVQTSIYSHATVASAGTLTPDAAYNETIAGTVNGNFTLAAPSNAPAAGVSGKLLISLKNTSGGAITVTPNAAYRFGANITSLTCPANGKWAHWGFIWCPADSKWDAVLNENGY